MPQEHANLWGDTLQNSLFYNIWTGCLARYGNFLVSHVDRHGLIGVDQRHLYSANRPSYPPLMNRIKTNEKFILSVEKTKDDSNRALRYNVYTPRTERK